MCGWKKDTRESQTLSGVSSAEGEVSISLPNLDKRFYSRHLLPLTVQNLSDPFPDTFSPASPSERLQKRFFPIAKGTRHGLSYSPCI